MTDVDLKDKLLQDELRIKGPQQDAKITQRIAQDLALRAAIAIEQEQRVAAQARQEALAAEAQARGAAEVNAVAQLAALAPLYEARQEAARQVIEAVSALWRIEQEIRAGLQLVDRSLQSAELTIDPTMRGSWRQSLRDRAGLPSRHVLAVPKSWLAGDGQKVGATVCAAITASVIQPGAIVTAHDAIDFNFE